jgi:hypothetical protein
MTKQPRSALCQSQVYADLVGELKAPINPELKKHMNEYMDPVSQFR